MMDDRDNIVRQWAENYLRSAKREDDPVLYAVAEYAMATTKPLTMADVKWDANLHFLAGATTEDGDEVVMLSVRGESGILTASLDGSREDLEFSASELIPNGKEYDLRKITDTHDHPDFLEVLEDYEDAPDGTIVINQFGHSLTKRYDRWDAGSFYLSSEEMSDHTKHRVQRWGGKD